MKLLLLNRMERKVLSLMRIGPMANFCELLLCAFQEFILVRLRENLCSIVVCRLNYAENFVVPCHMNVLNNIPRVLTRWLLRHHVEFLKFFWIFCPFVVDPILGKFMPVVKKGIKNFI